MNILKPIWDKVYNLFGFLSNSYVKPPGNNLIGQNLVHHKIDQQTINSNIEAFEENQFENLLTDDESEEEHFMYTAGDFATGRHRKRHPLDSRKKVVTEEETSSFEHSFLDFGAGECLIGGPIRGSFKAHQDDHSDSDCSLIKNRSRSHSLSKGSRVPLTERFRHRLLDHGSSASLVADTPKTHTDGLTKPRSRRRNRKEDRGVADLATQPQEEEAVRASKQQSFEDLLLATGDRRFGTKASSASQQQQVEGKGVEGGSENGKVKAKRPVAVHKCSGATPSRHRAPSRIPVCSNEAMWAAVQKTQAEKMQREKLQKVREKFLQRVELVKEKLHQPQEKPDNRKEKPDNRKEKPDNRKEKPQQEPKEGKQKEEGRREKYQRTRYRRTGVPTPVRKQKMEVAYRSAVNYLFDRKFQVFAKSGKRKPSCSLVMSSVAHETWMRQADVLSGVGAPNFVVFMFWEFAGVKSVLNLGEYKRMLEKLCSLTDCDYWDTLARMCCCDPSTEETTEKMNAEKYRLLKSHDRNDPMAPEVMNMLKNLL